MASLECTLAVILLIVLHTSCWLILVGMHYSSQIFSSLPNLGPKIHGNFGILKPTSTREIRSVFRFSQGLKVPKSHPQRIWPGEFEPKHAGFGTWQHRTREVKKVGGFFLGVLEIFHFIWGKSVNPSSFVEICWVYPRWIGREKRWNSPSVMVLFHKKTRVESNG